MIPDLTRHDRWRLLTRRNVGLKSVWPWGHSIQHILAPKERGTAPGPQLVVASDFGGEHKSATHLIYVYLVVAGGVEGWASRMAKLRTGVLADRTMAYKSLGDGVRQAALPEFLMAAADLDAHLVAIAVDKRQKWLSTQPGYADDLRREFGLKCSWNPRALEALMRKAHFLALLLSLWAPIGAHVTWLTDEDEFVANEKRHDDALLTAGRLASMYLDQPMGIFALNTTTQDSAARHFEDLCSVADLTAGLLSDVSTGLSSAMNPDATEQRLEEPDLSLKARVLLDWFADRQMRLRKSLISINHHGAQSSVREIWPEPNPAITGADFQL